MAGQARQDPLLTILAPDKKILGSERRFPGTDAIGGIQVQDAASSGIEESGTSMPVGLSTGEKYFFGRWQPGWDGKIWGWGSLRDEHRIVAGLLAVFLAK